MNLPEPTGPSWLSCIFLRRREGQRAAGFSPGFSALSLLPCDEIGKSRLFQGLVLVLLFTGSSAHPLVECALCLDACQALGNRPYA